MVCAVDDVGGAGVKPRQKSMAAAVVFVLFAAGGADMMRPILLRNPIYGRQFHRR
jgi:hypothetical protein